MVTNPRPQLVNGTYKCAAISAVACTVIALVIDLHHWDVDDSTWISSEHWRFTRTVCCFAPVIPLVLYHRGKDALLLFIALTLAVVADMFLILRNNLITGISIFAVMQAILIYRHLQNGAVLSKYLDSPLLKAVIVGAGVVVVGNGLLWEALAAKGLAFPVLIYSTLLLASTISAYGSARTGILSATASRYAFWGMVLFVLCDISVGVGAAFGHTSEGQFIRSITGLFYTPSLLLLVRSGIK